MDRNAYHDIDVEEALAILDTAEVRIVEKQDDWSGGPWTDPEILHDGKWKSLCRTDMCDDVATGWCTTMTAEEWRSHYRESLLRAGYGARYSKRRFSIIDSLTDG